MSPYEIEHRMSDQSRIERRCAIIASGSDHFHRIPGTPASKPARREMPSFTAWKFVLIICIVGVAGFATGGVAISKSTNMVLPHMSAASAQTQTAGRASHDNPKCRSTKRDIAAYSRAVGQLDPWRASHRRLTAIYQDARQVKHEWYQKNCR